jgi:hypothetical protein
MRRLRYNIAGALGAILFVAVGFAALREADELWGTWLFSLTLGLLLFAVLLVAHRTGDRREFWIGFALFGWGYLSFSLIPSIEARLIVTKALSYLHQSRIFGIRAHGLGELSPFRFSPFYAPRVRAAPDENFIHIGHTLFTLLAAWLGGVLSRRLRCVSETLEVLM